MQNSVVAPRFAHPAGYRHTVEEEQQEGRRYSGRLRGKCHAERYSNSNHTGFAASTHSHDTEK